LATYAPLRGRSSYRAHHVVAVLIEALSLTVTWHSNVRFGFWVGGGLSVLSPWDVKIYTLYLSFEIEDTIYTYLH
jgi:hypothetical protein